MKKELEKFYDECDSTLKDCAKLSDMNVTDFEDPVQAYLMASCIKIYNSAKSMSSEIAAEFDELEKTVKENNELIKELVKKIDSLERKEKK